VQGLSGVGVGAAGGALELAEGAREPGADGPLGGVVGVGVAASHAGDGPTAPRAALAWIRSQWRCASR
jgi:hypothetical protein